MPTTASEAPRPPGGLGESPKSNPLGWKAADFRLTATDGRTYALADVKGPRGTLVMFICNHCPYVKAVADRIARDAKELAQVGVGAIAVMSNDPKRQPEDSFDRMKEFAKAKGFGFPYAIDETQAVARAYGAVCTPEFFGFNADLELQYHGRLDSSGRDPAPKDAKRELYEAMTLIARTGKGPKEQMASIGCSIKWREG
jgi:peroxiredoxin